MNLSCDVIKDLLLLYEDDLCCEESRRLVDEHLKNCATCSAYLKKLRLPEEMVIPEDATLPKQEQATIQKSFRKIKRRWVISLVSLLLALPLVFATGVMAYHEYQKEGLCFSNIDEILVGREFLSLMQQGDYQAAAKMLDFEARYWDIIGVVEDDTMDEEKYQWYLNWYYLYYGIEDIFHMSLEEFVAYQQSDFANYLEACGSTILSFRFQDAYKVSDQWTIQYGITERLADSNKEQTVYLSFSIRNGKLWLVSGSTSASASDTESVLGAIFREWRVDYFGRREER